MNICTNITYFLLFLIPYIIIIIRANGLTFRANGPTFRANGPTFRANEPRANKYQGEQVMGRTGIMANGPGFSLFDERQTTLRQHSTTKTKDNNNP
jgi:hypothetical protein